MSRVKELIDEGNRAERDGEFAQACALYHRAIEVDPRHVPAWLNLGAALEASGDLARAENAYRAVLDFHPGNAYAHFNLANVARARGDIPAAAELLRVALRGKPDFPEALVALADAVEALGRPQEALQLLERALGEQPDYFGACLNYGLLLRRLNRLDEAEDAFRRALSLRPDDTAARVVLAELLRATGRIAEALRVFSAARPSHRGAVALEAAELFSLLYSDQVPDTEIFERHRAFGARLDAAFSQPEAPDRRSRDPERPLRLGYVSADLHRHPVGLFLIPVLERRSRDLFHVSCYSTGRQIDEVTAQLKSRTDAWCEAASLGDEVLAERIRADRIDVLVDLTGHAGPCRLALFARRPAPVQVSWLGYLHSMGSGAIQYRLCDAYTDPPGEAERRHTETLVRLPAAQWCYRPLLDAPGALHPPCRKNGFPTFGSFNHWAKISPATRRLWFDVLLRLPRSRLIVLGIEGGRAAKELIDDLARDSIDPSRIRLVPRATLQGYFRWYDEVDIALDTIPYSGGTTTCDALWMRVPVITAPGSRSVSRSSASILHAVGLDDWIAAGPDDYARLASEKAADVGALCALRATLRERIKASPVMDEAGFTRGLEGAYREMWRRWCHS